MRSTTPFSPLDLFIEIGPNTILALRGEHGIELPLERLENGHLSEACKEQVIRGLREFIKKHTGRSRPNTCCAISARGVSLRRVTVPRVARDELDKLLLFQIEKEFPLTPDELAWGCRPIPTAPTAGNGSPATQEVLVVAVKKETLREYETLLSQCGLAPVFTLAALTRNGLCPPLGEFAVLELRRTQSELISFQQGAPVAMRVLPWGLENLTGKVAADSVASHEGPGVMSSEAVAGEIAALAQAIRPGLPVKTLFCCGDCAGLPWFTPALAQALGNGTECEPLGIPPGEGLSAALVGLRQACSGNGFAPPLILSLERPRSVEQAPPLATWKWAVLAGLFLIGAISVGYLEPLIQKPRLQKRIAEIHAWRKQLPNVEPELDFLQYLQTNQAHILDPITVIANAAPSGTRLESLAINRRGDVSIRAGLRDPQQVVDFRSKLIESGFFSALSVEEQTPTPDRQKLNVRMVGHLNPQSERKLPPLAPSRPETDQPRPGPTPERPVPVPTKL
jgi:hypothetical protein